MPTPLSLAARRACHRAAAAFALSTAVLAAPQTTASAETGGAILGRNLDMTREAANKTPRAEADQALADGWPLYRTERGQEAFNAAMATLAATETRPPAPQQFKGCKPETCHVALPALSTDGWLPAGRLWVSPKSYVLFARSPRLSEGRSYRRRAGRQLRYFVFHEFHNSTRNVDMYDTISSHDGAVFVPFYMSKEQTDAQGRTFVVVMQVAPHDVVSIHATNMGSAGPGIEVAKSVRDDLEPLQATAGILVATIVKAAAPQLEVVNHRGFEGRPMLDAYERRLEALRATPGAPKVTLPFVAAEPPKVQAARDPLGALVRRAGVSPPIPVAERGFAPPPTLTRASLAPGLPQLIAPIRPAVRPSGAAVSASEPQLLGPIIEAPRPNRARAAAAR